MSATAAPPVSPFKGLAAFEDSDLDALFFFGREREREMLVANLLAARLTVLYGESGVGKSSLLGAAVVRDLRAEAPDTVVVMHDAWSGPLDDLLFEVRGAREGYLILDQFEEYFLYHADEEGPGALLHDLPELLSETRVNVLIALREDALASLDAFKSRIPSVFANQLRLEHLDREAARRAVLGPVARWNELTNEHVEIEPELVDAVLDDVGAHPPEGRPYEGYRIEAPYLQLVLERIWDTERAAGSPVLRLETLRQLGGAAAIVRNHLDGALDALAPNEQDVAAEMFEHLVTPSGTKVAHRAGDLANYAHVPEDALRRVLAALTRDRIVHSVDRSDRYEIFHDVLAEPISAWRLQRGLQRERAAAHRQQRRLVVLAAASLLALTVVAGLAVWAFAERSTAKSQARHAHARLLEANALQQLAFDPRRSVLLALAAARAEPGLRAESVLRQSLLADRLRFLLHARGPVRSVAASRDGTLFAATAPHGRVLVGDLRTGRLLHRLVGHGPYSAVGFTGDLVVATTEHGVATEWRASSGRPIAAGRFLVAARRDGGMTLVPLTGRLATVVPHIVLLRAAPNFVAAAVEAKNGRVRTWVFDRRGRLLHVLPEVGIDDLDFSPDGRMLATASADGTAALWNARTGKRERTFVDPAGSSVATLAFSPDGRLLATGAQDGGVRVWTVATGVRLYFFVGHTNPITALAWSPDGRVLASGSLDRTIRLWGVQNLVQSGWPISTLTGDEDSVRSVAFSADGTRLVSGGDDGQIRVWDGTPEQKLDVVDRFRGPVVSALWAGDSIVAASTDGSVQIFSAATRRVRYALHEPAQRPFTSLATSSDGAVVAAGSTDGSTSVWSGRTGRLLDTVGGPAKVLAVAVSATGDLAASGDARGVVRVWGARGGHLRRFTSAGAGPVTSVAFSLRGDELAATAKNATLLWSVTSDRLLHRLPVTGVVHVTFSSDGRLVGTAGSDGTAKLWFAATGRLYRSFRGDHAPLTDLVFSSDGVLVATSGRDALGRIWNVRSGQVVHVLRGHFGTVSAIAFSLDRRWIATAGPISAGLWPMATGRLLFYLRGHSALLTSVSFSPTGYSVLTSSADGSVRTYTCHVCGGLAQLELVAEQRLARSS